MLYRIKVNLFIPDKSDSDEVWAKLKDYLQTKNIKSLVEEKSYIAYHKCFHDETPGKPCVNIERFEK